MLTGIIKNWRRQQPLPLAAVPLAVMGASLLSAQPGAAAVDTIAFMRPNVTGVVGANDTGNIATIGSDGSNEKVVISANTAANPAISKDGAKLAYQNNNQIWVADINGNNARQLTDTSDFRGAREPVWSPDGTRLAFQGTGAHDSLFHLYILTLSSGAIQQVTGTKPNPDTSVIHPAKGTIGTNESTNATSNDTDPAWSPDGKQLAFTSDRQYLTNGGTGIKTTNTEIFRLNLSTLVPTRVTVLPASNDEKNPVWAPNGQKIAFEARLDVTHCIAEVGSTQTNVTSANITQLTADRISSYEPEFSPDGTRLAFAREVSGNYNILTIRALPEDESNVALQLTRHSGRQPSWGHAAPVVKPTPGPHSISGRILINPTTGLSPVTVYLVAHNNFAAFYGPNPSPDIRHVASQSSPVSANGDYTFTNVPPGDYKVVPLDVGTYFKPVMASVTVSLNDIQNIDFLRAGTDSIAPKVTVDAPAAGTAAKVTLAKGSVSDTGGSGVQAVVVLLYRLGATSAANQIFNWETNAYVAGNSNDSGVFKVTTLSTDLKSWSVTLPTASTDKAGNYRIAAVGIDNAYKTSAYVNRDFTISGTTTPDKTAPTGTLTTPVTGNATSLGPISGTAADDVALDHVKIAIVRALDTATGAQYQYWNGTTWVTLTTVPSGTKLPPAQIAFLLLPRLDYDDTALPRVALTGKSANWSYTKVPSGTGTYYVAAAIYDKAQNDTILPGSPDYFRTITVGTAPSGNAPANDNFAKAQVITGAQSSAGGTNVGATKESGEPTHSGVVGAGGHTVWYRWSPPVSGDAVLFTVGSNFRNVIQVFEGTSLTSLTEVSMQIQDTGDADNNNNYQVAFTALLGHTYDISVDGRGAATGNIELNYQVTEVPDSIGHSPLALSKATAQVATASVQLGFNHALEAASASDPASFTVTVNGRTVAIESAGYNAVSHSVSLSLLSGALHTGDHVSVAWNGLQSAVGALVTGHTTVTAQ